MNEQCYLLRTKMIINFMSCHTLDGHKKRKYCRMNLTKNTSVLINRHNSQCMTINRRRATFLPFFPLGWKVENHEINSPQPRIFFRTSNLYKSPVNFLSILSIMLSFKFQFYVVHEGSAVTILIKV
jgi:hypothetical protein